MGTHGTEEADGGAKILDKNVSGSDHKETHDCGTFENIIVIANKYNIFALPMLPGHVGQGPETRINV